MAADLRYRFVTALIEQSGRFLIIQRCAPEAFLGLWEFPGDKVEPGESDEETLERAFRERLGIAVKVGRLRASRIHDYVGYSVEIALYQCELGAGQAPRALTVADFRWVTAAELEQYPFLPADQLTMDLRLAIKRETPKTFAAPIPTVFTGHMST